MTSPGDQPRFRRRATGIPGLDTLIHGGIIAGAVFIVQGPPGAGKTIMANQLCFHHAKEGGKALYVTLLAEAHDRLLWLMKEMTFYDPAMVPSNIYFISGCGCGCAPTALPWASAPLKNPASPRSAGTPPWSGCCSTSLGPRSSTPSPGGGGGRRLVVDGVDALTLTAVHPQRLGPFLTALINVLKEIGVTSIFTVKLTRLTSGPSVVSLGGLSALAENVILLRYQERAGRLHRLASVLKVGESAFDSAIREYTIGANGIEFATFAASAHPVATTADAGFPWDIAHD